MIEAFAGPPELLVCSETQSGVIGLPKKRPVYLLCFGFLACLCFVSNVFVEISRQLS